MSAHQSNSPSAIFLPKHEYLAVVKSIPIATIDLIVRDNQDHVLLGWRKNRPAKDSWFVPGGRLFKNERMGDAFARICRTELGADFGLEQAVFRGIFELFFDDNFAEADGIGTHNISLAYDLALDARLSADILRPEQHSDYKWFSMDELLEKPDVHPGTKAYFQRTPARTSHSHSPP